MRRDRFKAELGTTRAGRERAFGDLLVRFLVDEPRRRRFSVLHIRIPPAGRHAKILHRSTEEFFLVLEGEVRAVIGLRRHVLREGRWGYLPPGTPHEFRAGPRGARVLSVFAPAMDFEAPDIRPAT